MPYYKSAAELILSSPDSSLKKKLFVIPFKKTSKLYYIHEVVW